MPFVVDFPTTPFNPSLQGCFPNSIVVGVLISFSVPLSQQFNFYSFVPVALWCCALQSGHGTKSSILYLHSPGVRPKVIVRSSGHPLIRDSLSSPWTRLQWRRVRHANCLRHCKAGSSSKYFTEDFEHKDSVRLCKISSTYHHRENNIWTNLICWCILQRDIMPWPSLYLNRFTVPPQRV